MSQNIEGQVFLILLGLLAYYLVSHGSYLGDRTGHINKAKLGSEIKKYTVEEYRNNQ